MKVEHGKVNIDGVGCFEVKFYFHVRQFVNVVENRVEPSPASNHQGEETVNTFLTYFPCSRRAHRFHRCDAHWTAFFSWDVLNPKTIVYEASDV